MTDTPMKFICDFLKYAEDFGICDEYDPDEDIMVTSEEVQMFIHRAMELRPPRLKNGGSAKLMRELTDEERSSLIEESPEVVVDMRGHFAREMAVNGGARGLLEKLIHATSTEEVDTVMQMAAKFVKEDFNEIQT